MIIRNLRDSKFLPNNLGDFKMNKLLLTTILTMGIALASAPVMARGGADDAAGHDATEHAGGHEVAEHGGGHDAAEHGGGDNHAGGDQHAGGHETAEQEAAEHAAEQEAEHAANDTPAPAI